MSNRLNHVDAMRVSQAHIHLGRTSWFVVTANGYPVTEGYRDRKDAEAELERIRREAREEVEEDAA